MDEDVSAIHALAQQPNLSALPCLRAPVALSLPVTSGGVTSFPLYAGGNLRTDGNAESSCPLSAISTP